MSENTKTREDFLTEAAVLIEEEILSPQGVSLPEKWKIGVGFPSSSTAIGQAWSAEACEDKETMHVIISPELGNHDKVNLLQVLLHELIHIAVGIDQKHGGEFKRVARAVGLEGRLTATYVSPNTELHDKLLEIYSKVGYDYPHVVLQKTVKEKKERVSNFIKLVSVSNPEYELKIKRDFVEEHGFPQDYNGEEMVEKEDE